jgi:hypothetical protein
MKSLWQYRPLGPLRGFPRVLRGLFLKEAAILGTRPTEPIMKNRMNNKVFFHG